MDETQRLIQPQPKFNVPKSDGGLWQPLPRHWAGPRAGRYRFFGELPLDCLHRTEVAMAQAHAFKAAELCLLAQQAAKKFV